MLEKLVQQRSLVAAFLAVAVLSGCLAVTPTASVSAADTAGESQQTEQPAVVTVNSATAESEALLYMREEEKLAHDVYVALYDKWGTPIFNNISRAESQHMSAVLQQIDARGLIDPVDGNGPGEFTNADVQSLYDDLVTQGSESVVSALLVGATIEDLDIADLQESLTTVTDEDVRWVFDNLLRGSENHMRAFVRNLTRYGETYEPQYIDADYYESIVAAGGATQGPQVGRGQGRGARWQR